jgi:hypothetical protein
MVAILPKIAVVKLLSALMLLAALCDLAGAQGIPLPRPRPDRPDAGSAGAPQPEEPAPPSACRLRLTPALAVAPSLPPVSGPGECGVEDAVRLEAVVLADMSRVAVTPPAILRCTFAEAVVSWVREDVNAAVRSLDAILKGIDNFASYDCRGRNRVAGARVSEHGKGNAIDIRAIRGADGRVVELTDPLVPRDFREALRKSACARFATVLGPGSDGYHENHVHVDLIERRGGYRMCQWDVREPGSEPATSAAPVPLPRPRPSASARQ